jgi:polysaccharide export outer membrane protein
MIKTLCPFPVIRKILATAICIIGTFFSFSSCKVYKPGYYFRDINRDTTISGFKPNNEELKIQKADILTISISSLSNSEDLLFNKSFTNGEAGKNSGFQVSPDGNVYIHKLGKVMAEGLTRKELKAKLETGLLPFLKDPIVAVSFANHRITVLAEASSKIVEMPEEKISLLEVLAQGGGTVINSQLNKVMVIREADGAKQIKHINLEDPSIFTSDWYYLRPNDVVVVKPDEEKIDDEQKRSRNQVLFTSILAGATFLIFVIDRIFR